MIGLKLPELENCLPAIEYITWSLVNLVVAVTFVMTVPF